MPMRMLDLGAGNCWLSGQLARRGYRVEALDVNVDDEDGLAAARHLLAPALAVAATDCSRVAGHAKTTAGTEVCGVAFGRVQASLECLPYLDCQFDAVIAAASLHYAFDLDAAVDEAARVLRIGGALILLDTPLYRQGSAGQAVVERRIADQRRQYGSDGNGVTGRAYLDVAALRRSMARAGLTYREVPVHGAVHALLGRLRRAAWALRRREERAQMPLVIGVRPC
jgi:SAM-dependent methyltransferase